MNDDWGILLLIGVIIGLAVGSFGGRELGATATQRQAIEHHVGQYNPITGEFEWLKCIKKTL